MKNLPSFAKVFGVLLLGISAIHFASGDPWPANVSAATNSALLVGDVLAMIPGALLGAWIYTAVRKAH